MSDRDTDQLVNLLTNQIHAIFRAFESSCISSSYDFGSGHLDYDVIRDLPENEKERLKSLLEKMKRGKIRKNKWPRLEDSIHEILTLETSLNVPESRIKPFHTSTRGALDHLFSRILPESGVIALPLPNWDFWKYLEGANEGRYGFQFFSALTPDQLVDNYQKVASKSGVDALLIVSPANPMGFRLDKEVLGELDAISTRNGIKVVVDDLLRGNLPLGDRESIAAHFSHPYLVEGFSHRFGDMPLGRISYILVPEGEKRIEPPVKDIPCICSEILAAAYQYSSPKIFAEIKERNRAFDKGIRKKCPDVQITRPSYGSITSVVRLPDRLEMGAREFKENAGINGIEVYPVSSFYPSGVSPDPESDRMLRVSVGSMDVEEIKEGAKKLGVGIDFIARQ